MLHGSLNPQPQTLNATERLDPSKGPLKTQGKRRGESDSVSEIWARKEFLASWPHDLESFRGLGLRAVLGF